MNTQAGITITNLTKKFPKQETNAVDNLSLTVKPGTIFGFLGPNGAGKSTTVRLLTTLLTPSTGSAIVAGYDINTHPEQVRQNVGLLPEEGGHTLYPRMSAEQHLIYYGQLYGLTLNEAKDNARELLEFLELEDRQNDPTGIFSSGMRQKLALARALIHDPQVLFLDEPLSGIDPLMSMKIKDFINRLSTEKKKTVFICSHVLSTVQELCQAVGIIDEGKLLQIGTIHDLTEQLWTTREYRLHTVDSPEKVKPLLQDQGLISTLDIVNNRINYEIDDPAKNNPQIIQLLVKNNIQIISLSEDLPSLEEVYLEIIRSKGGNQ